MLKKQNGFGIMSVIIILFGIIVIGGAGAIGFAYYKGADLKSLDSIINTLKGKEPIFEKEEKNEEENKEEKEEENCIKERESVLAKDIADNKNPSCCTDLTFILENAENSEKGFCMACGNGSCEEPENHENCPADCEEAADMAEGEMSAEELARDTDNDGLKDFEEAWYGTDPEKKDTDGDTYLDGAELKGGYNPNGEGFLALDFSTPEGAVLFLEKERQECNFEKYENKYVMTEEDLNKKITDDIKNILKMSYLIEEIKANELREELLNELRDKNIYLNNIKRINFLKRKPLNSNKLNISYEITYLADERGYVPNSDYFNYILEKKEDEWHINLTDMFINEIENGAVNLAQASRNDDQRISDIEKIRTALETCFNETEKYPNQLVPGEEIRCNNQLILEKVPSNPEYIDGKCAQNFEYEYIVKENGKSYELKYCLEKARGLKEPSGYHVATPQRLMEEMDERKPFYKECYVTEEERDIQRISDIKQIQTALEFFYTDHGIYPAEIKSGEALKGGGETEEKTYFSEIPTAPPAENTACSDYPNYQYMSKKEGQAYILKYCLEIGTGGIEDGLNFACESGINNCEDY